MAIILQCFYVFCCYPSSPERVRPQHSAPHLPIALSLKECVRGAGGLSPIMTDNDSLAAVDMAALLCAVVPSAEALRPRGHSDCLTCVAVACLYHALRQPFPIPTSNAQAAASAIVSPETAAELRAQVLPNSHHKNCACACDDFAL